MSKSNECYILTRYLYIKAEVESALKRALLKKCEKETLFWAYELYYSGFIEDLMCVIFNIYYEYYYTLNPSFESYLIVKYKLLLNSDETKQPQIIYQIISNLIIRNSNEDVISLLNMNMNTNQKNETKTFKYTLLISNKIQLYIIKTNVQKDSTHCDN